jgi:hypothetical protein
MIEVSGCKSTRILRSQARNRVLTIAAFISGYPSDGSAIAYEESRRVGAADPQQLLVMPALPPSLKSFGAPSCCAGSKKA